MDPIKLDLQKDNLRLIQLAHTESWIETYIPVLQRKELEEEGGVTEISLKNLDFVMRKFGNPCSAEVVAHGSILFYFDEAFALDNPMADHLVLPPVYLATGLTIGYRGEGPSGLAQFLHKHWDLPFEKTLSFIAGLPQEYRGVIIDHCFVCQ